MLLFCSKLFNGSEIHSEQSQFPYCSLLGPIYLALDPLSSHILVSFLCHAHTCLRAFAPATLHQEPLLTHTASSNFFFPSYLKVLRMENTLFREGFLFHVI